MDPKLKAAVEALQKKQAELKAALENIKTPEDLQKAQGLREEVKSLKQQVEFLTKAGEIGEEAEETDRFLTEPAGTLPLPGVTTKAGTDGADLLGSLPAGDTTIDRKTLAVLAEQGDGIFGEKVWAAVRAPEYKRAFRTYISRGLPGLPYRERKALEEGLDPQGGYLVPPQMLAALVARKPTPTRVAGMVQTIRTSRDAVVMPKLNYTDGNDLYTTGFRVTNTGEKPSSATVHRVNDADLFGEIRIEVFTFMMSTVLSKDFAEDAASDPLQFLQDKFQETIDLHRDNMILNGNGRTEPVGLLLNAGAGDPAQPPVVLSGVAGGLGYDGFVDLMTDVPEQYEDNLKFLFNKRSTYRALLKIKDTANKPLFTTNSALTGARPTDILGYGFSFSGFMPSVAANAYPILFGDFRGYTVADRIGFSIQILTEKYAENNQLGVVGRVRFGGRCLEPWRLRILKSNNA